jgi:hypothetical protein
VTVQNTALDQKRRSRVPADRQASGTEAPRLIRAWTTPLPATRRFRGL